MTIEELRGRRRELLERKKREMELQAAGEGDKLALFMVNEELLDVNAQLRALAPRRRAGSRGTSSDHFANGAHRGDKKQYTDWTREDRNYDEELDEAHALLLDALRESGGVLSGRQKRMLDLWKSGLGVVEIADRLGVAPSTVSRTLERAKERIRADAQRRQNALRVPEGRADLSDPETARAVLSALSRKQAVYLYLYYSEWLSLREVSQLTGRDHSVILRTMRRGLARVRDALGGGELALENMDALDDLLFALYLEIQDMVDDEPEEVRSYIRGGPRGERQRRKDGKTRAAAEDPGAVCLSRLGRGVCHGDVPEVKRGKLYQALMERRRRLAEDGRLMAGDLPVFRWLLALFRRLEEQRKEKQQRQARRRHT